MLQQYHTMVAAQLQSIIKICIFEEFIPLNNFRDTSSIGLNKQKCFFTHRNSNRKHLEII